MQLIPGLITLASYVILVPAMGWWLWTHQHVGGTWFEPLRVPKLAYIEDPIDPYNPGYHDYVGLV